MSDPATLEAAATALVMCREAQVTESIVESLRPLAIRPEICDQAVAANNLLDRQKFEAVIVDLRLGEEARLVMGHLRFSRANHTAVTFTITSGDPAQEAGARPDSTFVLQRPLSVATISPILRAAYGLVVRERRRYFRCPVAIPVYVDAQGPKELLCQTVNISEGGIAIRCPTNLDADVPLRVRFSLPDRSSRVFAETKVCWRGEGKLVGLAFQFLQPLQKSELQEWLARKLEETLPQEVATLFRSAGQVPP